MSEPQAPTAQPPTLESVLRSAWDAFHPDQPAPLGWLTHTTTQIQAHLREHHPVAQPQSQPSADQPVDLVAQFRSHLWHALREAVSEHDIDIDAANRVLEALDMPLLPRRWQVRLALPILMDVTAATRDEAFDTAEAAVETALTSAELEARIEWDDRVRDDADPGDFDPAAADRPNPGQ
ncbi:hypothetical protein B0E53_04967 [Micromonospora sp. MH33]|uniref:hypothetical protein n=1 Tax=Micromonospora sp. MH33 TaxID=1945509 RepID=UPI000D147CCB|nr:hypothetical protein [Micromonospora sp. MH33]PSK63098.1 hypothetical protein B0E53_04967 [Micromonospora sp. MH33]